MLVLSHNKDRAWGVPDEVLGDTAKKKMSNPGVAMGGNDDQIYILLLREFAHFDHRIPRSGNQFDANIVRNLLFFESVEHLVTRFNKLLFVDREVYLAVDCAFGIGVDYMRHVELGVELGGEADRVLDRLRGAIGKVGGHQDFFESNGRRGGCGHSFIAMQSTPVNYAHCQRDRSPLVVQSYPFVVLSDREIEQFLGRNRWYLVSEMTPSIAIFNHG